MFHVKHYVRVREITFTISELINIDYCIINNYIHSGDIMNKEEVLQHLSMGKKIHSEWIEQAKKILKPGEYGDELKPSNGDECAFSRWLVYEGQILSKLSNNPVSCMQNIERLHRNVHELYEEIFVLCCGEKTQGGLLTKIFGSKEKERDPDKTHQAQEKVVELERVSKELLSEIERLERRIGAVSEEKIASLE